MNIRTIKPEDSRSYVLLKRETWLNTYVNLELGITKEAIENWYSNIEERINKAKIYFEENLDSSENWVAEIDREIVAILQISKLKNSILALYVLPKFQHKGIGSALIQKALSELDLKKDIFVNVATYNQKAIDFYKKFGFKIVGPIEDSVALPNGVVIPELEMIRSF